MAVDNITILFIVGFILCMVNESVTQLSHNRDELLNWCLDSKHHKKKPGEESELFKYCLPWKNRSCCTQQTTRDIHTGKLYNFDFNHCKHEVNKGMSEKCERHFLYDHCFYECSPNIGPWVVRENKTFRSEKFFNVPLCFSDCQSWWNACKDDYTCTNNWSQNFDWVNKVNKCPKEAKCSTISNVFRNAKDFCEMVWDHSWKVVGDDQACMRMWFNNKDGNPNDNVAEIKVNQLLSESQKLGLSHFLAVFVSLFLSLVF